MMVDDPTALIESDVVGLAEAMPAEAYDFVPTDGMFDGARTFGEQVRHLATMVYMTAALVLEERTPYGPGTHNNGPDDIRSKEAILHYLRGAFRYARRAGASITPANAMDLLDAPAFGRMTRSAIASGIAYHSYNHYGQMVVYARMNGIVPPGSVPTGDEARVAD